MKFLYIYRIYMDNIVFSQSNWKWFCIYCATWPLILPPFTISFPSKSTICSLPACSLFFYLDIAFLLFSCPLYSSGNGGTRHEEVPAKDSRAPLNHQETGGQKCTTGRWEKWTCNFYIQRCIHNSTFGCSTISINFRTILPCFYFCWNTEMLFLNKAGIYMTILPLTVSLLCPAEAGERGRESDEAHVWEE